MIETRASICRAGHGGDRAGVTGTANRIAPDGRESIDPLSGMAFLSGIPVEVTAA